MYIDLKSKLKLYADGKCSKQVNLKNKDNDIDKVLDGSVEVNEFGAFFIHEKRYPLDFFHGDLPVGDILRRDNQTLLKFYGNEKNDITVREMIFLDTETTGLGGAGTVAFLVGIGYFEKEAFIIKQLFMRDYDEEAAMLKYLDSELLGRKGVVSFNGKAFDWNLLNSRFISNRMRQSLKDPVQIDLLYPSRTLWKRKLESCRLTSLEENILNIGRHDDIPGALIPSTYFKYLEDKSTTEIKRVLEHNESDILSMVTLFSKISALINKPLEESDDWYEILGAASIYERISAYDKSEACLTHCSISKNHIIKIEALKRLAYVYKKRKEYIKVIECYEAIIKSSKTPNIPIMVELAKCYEHRLKDINKAIEIVKEALNMSLNISLVRGVYYNDLKYRLDRLIGKYSVKKYKTMSEPPTIVNKIIDKPTENGIIGL
ncbi:MAG: ribonuclease H-like domain-containing protein [Bacillota bacterium]|nr:ribonuclease H-like domain-containing protein [Bacillota bacterium]